MGEEKNRRQRLGGRGWVGLRLRYTVQRKTEDGRLKTEGGRRKEGSGSEAARGRGESQRELGQKELEGARDRREFGVWIGGVESGGVCPCSSSMSWLGGGGGTGGRGGLGCGWPRMITCIIAASGPSNAYIGTSTGRPDGGRSCSN